MPEHGYVAVDLRSRDALVRDFPVERAAQKLLIDLRHEPKSEMERIEKEAKNEDEERAKNAGTTRP